MERIHKLLYLLSERERRQAFSLLLLSVFIAVVDAAGVASIMPFMAVMTDPEVITRNPILSEVYEYFAFSSEMDFLVFLGTGLFSLLIGSLILKAIGTYLTLKFTRLREYTIGRKMYSRYLEQNYSYFVSRHSAEINKIILSEVAVVVTSGLAPLLTIVSQGIVVFVLITMLIFVDWQIAIISGLALSVIYGLLFYATEKLVMREGAGRAEANNKRFMSLSESAGALKEIKLKGFENSYIERFSFPAKKYANHLANGLAISQLPRFALEGLIFGGLILASLFLVGSGSSAISLIALYAFAGYRLMPALQQIYACITQLRLVDVPLNSLYHDLTSLPARPVCDEDAVEHDSSSSISSLEFQNVSFKYPGSDAFALKSLDLKIERGDLIGLVGLTGSGKTTLVDLILGLFDPTDGEILVNGLLREDNFLKRWSQSVAYVPQDIFIADETLKRNIAFGIPAEDINDDAVKKAAKLASLDEFVMSLPEKYETVLGERGGKLSGGQKQRVGIARALYTSPNLLVMDEATSALDTITERQISDSIKRIAKDITVVIVAHRMSTIMSCKKIYLLEGGKISASGSFDELVQANKKFGELARAGERRL
ncbi:ABC transporter ATP-binding protein/permease [Gammaproteobacteria bacterium]|nr:ABC transporter ATP-binding protein/permease [Gammaproteobacteria bacterium]